MVVRYLEILEAIAETGTFTGAAKKLFITQSAVSHAVAELEKQAGTALFERLPKGVILTRCGASLLEESRGIVTACRNLDRRITHLEENTPVAIVSSITIASFLLPEILGELQTAFPQIRLSVRVVSANAAIAILQRGNADIAFWEGAAPGAEVEGATVTPAGTVTGTPAGTDTGTPASSEGNSGLVPMKDLVNLKSLRKKATDEQLAQAYNVAAEIVTPYIGSTREEQLYGIASTIRAIFDSGMTYSMSDAHYNDPYGYFILGSASCAGCTRATGLCLNMLGIPYEHVNENQYSHQWCRVEVNGTYWICDAFGLYCGPEPEPYKHPYLQ